MNMLPVLARAFGVDPVAFERQVEAYENPDRLEAAEARAEALEAECGRLRELVSAGVVVIQNAIACDLLPEGRRELLDQWVLDVIASLPPGVSRGEIIRRWIRLGEKCHCLCLPGGEMRKRFEFLPAGGGA